MKALFTDVFNLIDEMMPPPETLKGLGGLERNRIVLKLLSLRHKVGLIERAVLNTPPEPNLDYNEEDISLAGSIT